MSNYSDLLRHPKWQKARLQILSAFGWACTKCGDEDSELHVHHKYYLPGKMPWEYPTDCYDVLCANCHKKEHGLMQKQPDNYCLDGRPVRTIRQIMLDVVEEMQRRLKK